MFLPLPDNFDIQNQFLDFLKAHDLDPIDNVSFIIDNSIHRYRIRGDKQGETSGAYCLYSDGDIPAGWAEDWHIGQPVNWHYQFSDQHFSKEQRDYFHSDAYKQKLEAEKKLKEEKRKNKQLLASRDARANFDSCPEAPENFPYLKDKKIFPYGVRLFDNGLSQSLVVPLRDINGRIQSVQWINVDGKKQFFPGASTKGLF